VVLDAPAFHLDLELQQDPRDPVGQLSRGPFLSLVSGISVGTGIPRGTLGSYLTKLVFGGANVAQLLVNFLADLLQRYCWCIRCLSDTSSVFVAMSRNSLEVVDSVCTVQDKHR